MKPFARYLVFHGGSGSTKEEISTAVRNGVVKMNVDTDTQFAYLVGMRVSFSSLSLLVCSVTHFAPSRTSSTRRRITSRPRSATPRVLTSLTRRYEL
jgi:fructose/tagatose bisphosphate aldolase